MAPTTQQISQTLNSLSDIIVLNFILNIAIIILLLVFILALFEIKHHRDTTEVEYNTHTNDTSL